MHTQFRLVAVMLMAIGAAALASQPIVANASSTDATECRATHTVRRGETLSLVARRYGVTTTALRAANRLRTSVIHAGNRLCIPAGTPVGPQFLELVVSPGKANPGDQIQISWRTQGATRVGFVHWLPNDRLGPQGQGYLAPNGSIGFKVSEVERNYARLMFTAHDGAGRTASRELQVPLACPHAYFFAPKPDQAARCPEGPAQSVDAAVQRFENGIMLWLRRDGGPSQVYAIHADGTARQFTDTHVDGEPESAQPAPVGRYIPVRGFGKIWRNHREVREKLGYAIASEAGFRTVVQQENASLKWRGARLFVRLDDGRTLLLLSENPFTADRTWARADRD